MWIFPTRFHVFQYISRRLSSFFLALNLCSFAHTLEIMKCKIYEYVRIWGRLPAELNCRTRLSVTNSVMLLLLELYVNGLTVDTGLSFAWMVSFQSDVWGGELKVSSLPTRGHSTNVCPSWYRLVGCSPSGGWYVLTSKFDVCTNVDWSVDLPLDFNLVLLVICYGFWGGFEAEIAPTKQLYTSIGYWAEWCEQFNGEFYSSWRSFDCHVLWFQSQTGSAINSVLCTDA